MCCKAFYYKEYFFVKTGIHLQHSHYFFARLHLNTLCVSTESVHMQFLNPANCCRFVLFAWGFKATSLIDVEMQRANGKCA